MTTDKAALIERWRSILEERLAVLSSNQTQAQAGTRVDGTHRPENRGERAAVTSQGYLAHGLQQRIEQLVEQLRLLDEMGTGPRTTVVVGAVVELEVACDHTFCFALFPGGDATVVEQRGQSIQILSPQAPMVQPLRGLCLGDGTEIERAGERQDVEITRLS